MTTNPSTMINFWKPKWNDDEATRFHDEDMPKAGSDYICLAVIIVDFILQEDENYYAKVFLKNVNTLRKKNGD